jgi:hypothetical protein
MPQKQATVRKVNVIRELAEVRRPQLPKLTQLCHNNDEEM